MPAVSLVATLVATMLGFVLGALWYGPLFGRRWMTAVGMTAEEIQKDFNPAIIYGVTFVLGLIASYVFGLYVARILDAHSRLSPALQPGSAGWRRRSRPTTCSRDGLPRSSPSMAGIMLSGSP